MLKRGPVTPADALKVGRIYRLASRINELRQMGHNIVTEHVQRGSTRYARYHLVKGKNG